jgi:hypothetical protein
MALTLAVDTYDEVNFHDPDAHAERRRGLRIRQARPIKVYEAAGAKYFGGITEDISATGLRIELPASSDLRPGKIVNVHVGASSAGVSLANRRHMIPAKVVWIAAGESLAVVVAGVEFIPSIAAHLDAA